MPSSYNKSMLKKILGYGRCALPLSGMAIGVLAYVFAGKEEATAHYLLAVVGFFLLFVDQLVVPIWAGKKPEKKWATGLFDVVMVSLLPPFLFLNGFMAIHPGSDVLWVPIAFGVLALFEIAYLVYEIRQKETNRAIVSGLTLVFLSLLLLETIAPLFFDQIPEAIRLTNMVLNFVAVALYMGAMVALFFTNRGLKFLKGVIAWCVKHHIGLFLTSGYAIYMGILAIIFCSKNDVWAADWSLPVFFFSIATIRLWALAYDWRCRKKYSDPDILLRRQYLILIVGGATILTLGTFYGTALSSFGVMENTGKHFTLFNISNIVFILFRSLFGVRSILRCGKEKNPFRYVNYACDILDILFCLFQIVELLLMSFAQSESNVLAAYIILYVVYALLVSNSFFVLIRMLVHGVKGMKACNKAIEARQKAKEAAPDSPQ